MPSKSWRVLESGAHIGTFIVYWEVSCGLKLRGGGWELVVVNGGGIRMGGRKGRVWEFGV